MIFIVIVINILLWLERTNVSKKIDIYLNFFLKIIKYFKGSTDFTSIFPLIIIWCT